MKFTENSLNILTAKSYKGIGNAWMIKNLKGNESVETVVSLLNKSIKGEKTSLEEFEYLKKGFKTKLIEKFENYCDGFVALGDPDFPQCRGVVKDSERPVFLYYKGDINLLSIENINITVIGLLNPEIGIEERERELVAGLVKNGAVITSGLAFGCDSISHKQALDSNGKTVAILPSPLNKILPARNSRLAHDIVENGGLLITEYGKDFKSGMELNSRYKERDRLQALFCDTIVLAASYSKDSDKNWDHLRGQKLDSGARLAMAYAKDYNIPRAVMYDENLDQTNPMFDLNRQIIKEDSDVIVINQDNSVETIKKMLSNKPTVNSECSLQQELFR